ncbi:hypothetical protein BDQ17DRAFT_1350193 [Cyathus striatus]|nr:hypothetical protein BDQ17DRAFT_1350193 [Cyathus striatus]
MQEVAISLQANDGVEQARPLVAIIIDVLPRAHIDYGGVAASRHAPWRTNSKVTAIQQNLETSSKIPPENKNPKASVTVGSTYTDRFVLDAEKPEGRVKRPFYKFRRVMDRDKLHRYLLRRNHEAALKMQLRAKASVVLRIKHTVPLSAVSSTTPDGSLPCEVIEEWKSPPLLHGIDERPRFRGKFILGEKRKGQKERTRTQRTRMNKRPSLLTMRIPHSHHRQLI